MLFSKEYVGYLAREVTNKLIEGEFIETPDKPAVTGTGPRRAARRAHAGRPHQRRSPHHPRHLLRRNARSGANYQEMFKKIKNELVRKYKAVL